MRRLNLKHCYHDGRIQAIHYHGDTDVTFEVRLCGCCNPTTSVVTLSLHGIRNFQEVYLQLEETKRTHAERAYIDEVIGLVRDKDRGYLLDLTSTGCVYIDAKDMAET